VAEAHTLVALVAPEPLVKEMPVDRASPIMAPVEVAVALAVLAARAAAMALASAVLAAPV
jgi:hypothetical protein